ncbi:arylsulfotransferase family protein [Natrialbaceae archaeon GCM10025810]|uniref:arylsulfotransferase family protein n=1 Tax=Halovalidus salilacus TaxID=3075124 RepID=UPI003621B512
MGVLFRIPGFTRTRIRIALAFIVVLSAAVVADAAVNDRSTVPGEAAPDSTPAENATAPPTENHTVVTESGRAGTITAHDPDGEVIYHNDSRTKYFDVDPVEGEPMTVEYTASDTIHSEGPTCSDPPCVRNVIERTNLSTGEVEVVYERYDYTENAGEWHDADRIDDDRYLVADIIDDQVFVVDTETGVVEWLWDAQADYPLESGHAFPRDWLHINDVEYIEEGEMAGTIMISPRNLDQVIFVDPDEGVIEDWTLGEEHDEDVLYAQHNPDYIPEDRGGPAVLVADSENDRIVEYQREDGEWNQTWEWSDERADWPRDADRLPNGNTLITDSHGERVVEVDESGDVVWQTEFDHPYEAERLETGDESEGGRSAAELDLESHTPAEDDGGESEAAGGDGGFVSSSGETLVERVESALPQHLEAALLAATPSWIGATEAAALAAGLLSGLLWIGLEVAWRLRDAGVTVRSPVARERE